MKKWKMVWCGGDPSNAKVFGVYIENYPSKFLNETVTVEEPRYHQKFQAFKYEVEINGRKRYMLPRNTRWVFICTLLKNKIEIIFEYKLLRRF